VQADEPVEPAPRRPGQPVVSRAHVREQGPAPGGRHFQRVQEGQAGESILVRLVGVPRRGPGAPEAVDAAGLVDVGDVRHVETIFVTVLLEDVRSVPSALPSGLNDSTWLMTDLRLTGRLCRPAS
jgi:hypothetical protein